MCIRDRGVPAALRQLWGQPDAFVGVVHRLDTGVSGLMVFARTPGAAAALSRQITQSQNAYAVQDGRAEGKPEVPQFIKRYRAVIAGGPDEALPAEGTLRDWLFKDLSLIHISSIIQNLVPFARGNMPHMGPENPIKALLLVYYNSKFRP